MGLNNGTPEISIIVPVYNVEKWIENCIRSVIAQTFNNWELILVNDGSLDNSQQICEKYAKKYSKIHLINKENGGLSDARNFGIKKAKGKYLAFVDGDDYIDSNYLSKLHTAIISSNASIAVCGYKEVDNKKKILSLKRTNDFFVQKLVSGQTFLRILAEKNCTLCVVAWNKLYKKDLFKNNSYKKGRLHEDEFIIAPLVYDVSKIALVDDELYNYVQRAGSIMSSKMTQKNLLDANDAFVERLNFYKSNKNMKLFDLTVHQYLLWILSVMKYPKKVLTKKGRMILQNNFKQYSKSQKNKSNTNIFKFQMKLGERNIKLAWVIAYIIPHGINRVMEIIKK